MLFALPCGAIGALRILPIVADTAILQAGLARYDGRLDSQDVLSYFVNPANPFTGGLLRSIYNAPLDGRYNTGYLGYINLFFLASALRCASRRERLWPWIALFVFFAFMRLGEYLTVNGVPYPDIRLPDRVLSDILPNLFGQIGESYYFVYGLITPFAVLSCFGLVRLIRGRSERRRALVALSAILVLMLEFYVPITGQSIPNGATAYVDWLKSEPDDTFKLINVPVSGNNGLSYALYVQTLAGYPIAYGHLSRIAESTHEYVDRNLLLREWRAGRSVRCSDSQTEYQQASDELLDAGFTHVTFDRWQPDAELMQDSFTHVPAAYDDGLVSVYRLSDLRRYCAELPIELAGISHFLKSSWGAQRSDATLLSYYSQDRIESDYLAYLDGLIANTTDWKGLIHLYVDQGAPTFQTAPGRQLDADDLAELYQIIYVVYQSRASAPAQLAAAPPLDRYHSCGMLRHGAGWVSERYLRRDFSCDLLASPASSQVQYDNGAHLANLLVAHDEARLDIQLRWGALPRRRHSFSVQFFDAAGA